MPLLRLPPAELLAEQSSHYQRHVCRYVRRSSAKHYLTPQPLEINSDVLLARQDSDSATQPPEEGTGDRRSREAMITEASLGGVWGCIPLRHPTAAGWGPCARTHKESQCPTYCTQPQDQPGAGGSETAEALLKQAASALAVPILRPRQAGVRAITAQRPGGKGA